MILHIDIETRSYADLKKLGVYRYSEDPGFSILLFAYAYDDRPVSVIDLAQGEEIPEEVLTDLIDSTITKSAYNAQFERVCLNRYFNLDTGPWHCSMIQANCLGLRGSLSSVGAALNLAPDEQKLMTGKNLIRLFSLPRIPSSRNGYRTIYEPEDRPKEWEQFKDYCQRDVVAERVLFHKLSAFSMPDSEQDLYALDQAINDRGVRIDLDLAQSATCINDELYKHYEEDFKAITGIDTPSQLKSFKEWIKKRTGVTVDSITKGNLISLQKQFADYPDVVDALEIRGMLSRTSVKKYEAMEILAGEDDRARGLFRFFGASTGRWAGRGIQPQNLPQNHLSDLDTARQLIRQRDLESIEMFYEDPADVLSQCIRTAIIPSDGCSFLVADFAAIEARIIAWLANEKWRLDVFSSHGKIYEASAAHMFNVPVEQIGKGDPLRQKGKIAELALGYQGSVGALKQMGALKMGIPEEDLQPLVNSWRQSNPRIVQLWYDTERMVQNCIISGRPQKLNDYVSCRLNSSFLLIKLPSGREIAYPKVSLRPHQKFSGRTEITYQEVSGWEWVVKGTYGGKLVENIIQAIARDCLAAKMLALDHQGYKIVMHVHDEVVVEDRSETAEDNLKLILEVMSKPLPWAPGLPLSADGYVCKYYQKD